MSQAKNLHQGSDNNLTSSTDVHVAQLYVVTPTAMMVSFGEQFDDLSAARVERFLSVLTASVSHWLVDYIPSYITVLIHHLPGQAAAVRAALLAMIEKSEMLDLQDRERMDKHQLINIPVCYDPELALDLEETAAALGLSVAELIAEHSERVYHCYALGFLPGFAFLGRLSDRLVIPRLPTPRQKLPAGSVAIAEQQTSVYPAATPGGWRIIGRSPMRMFFPDRNPPIRIQVGDRVRFQSISRADYECYDAKTGGL